MSSISPPKTASTASTAPSDTAARPSLIRRQSAPAHLGPQMPDGGIARDSRETLQAFAKSQADTSHAPHPNAGPKPAAPNSEPQISSKPAAEPAKAAKTTDGPSDAALQFKADVARLAKSTRIVRNLMPAAVQIALTVGLNLLMFGPLAPAAMVGVVVGVTIGGYVIAKMSQFYWQRKMALEGTESPLAKLKANIPDDADPKDRAKLNKLVSFIERGDVFEPGVVNAFRGPYRNIKNVTGGLIQGLTDSAIRSGQDKKANLAYDEAATASPEADAKTATHVEAKTEADSQAGEKPQAQAAASPKVVNLIDLTDAEQLHPNLMQPLTPTQAPMAPRASVQAPKPQSTEKSAFVQNLVDVSEPEVKMTAAQRIAEMGDLKI